MAGKNDDVKRYMRFCGVTQWRVAERLGVHEVTFNRWLRFALAPDLRKKILDTVDEIAAEMRAESEVTR